MNLPSHVIGVPSSLCGSADGDGVEGEMTDGESPDSFIGEPRSATDVSKFMLE